MATQNSVPCDLALVAADLADPSGRQAEELRGALEPLLVNVVWKTAWKSDPVSGVNSVQSGPTLRID